MVIYLAGPIFQCTDGESSNWRQKIKNELEWKGTKPQNRYDIIDPVDRDLRGKEDQLMKVIVEGDKELIDTCDILLVGLWKISAGTCMEILYAWEKGKKTYIINSLDNLSPWLKYHSHAIFNNIDETIDFLRRPRA